MKFYQVWLGRGFAFHSLSPTLKALQRCRMIYPILTRCQSVIVELARSAMSTKLLISVINVSTGLFGLNCICLTFCFNSYNLDFVTWPYASNKRSKISGIVFIILLVIGSRSALMYLALTAAMLC